MIEGKRQFWCDRKSTGFQDFAVRSGENNVSEVPDAESVLRNGVFEAAAHCQVLAVCLDATMAKGFLSGCVVIDGGSPSYCISDSSSVV